MSKLQDIVQSFKEAKALIGSVVFIVFTFIGFQTWVDNTFMLKAEATKYAPTQEVNELREDVAYNQFFIFKEELNRIENRGVSKDQKDMYRSLHLRVFKLKKQLKLIDQDTAYIETKFKGKVI